MKAAHLIALLLMNVLWAGSYAAFKALSTHLTAGELVTWRYGLSAAILAVLWPWLPGRAPRGADLGRTALMGLLVFVAGPRLQVLGVNLGRAGDASVAVAIEPLITAVAAALFLHEHIPGRRWAGFLVGMGGIVLLNGAWQMDLQLPSFVASLVFVSSFVAESAYSVVGKPILQRASPVKIIALSLFWGAGLNLVIDGGNAAAKAGLLRGTDWACLAFLVLVCTLIGYTLWFVVIRESDVNLAALTILVQPLFGVLIAAVFLHEPLHWGQWWGTLAILAGLALGLTGSAPGHPADPRGGADSRVVSLAGPPTVPANRYEDSRPVAQPPPDPLSPPGGG